MTLWQSFKASLARTIHLETKADVGLACSIGACGMIMLIAGLTSMS
jgi:hypothetical protein